MERACNSAALRSNNNTSNQKVSYCPLKGGELDPGHISIAHIRQLVLSK